MSFETWLRKFKTNRNPTHLEAWDAGQAEMRAPLFVCGHPSACWKEEFSEAMVGVPTGYCTVCAQIAKERAKHDEQIEKLRELALNLFCVNGVSRIDGITGERDGFCLSEHCVRCKMVRMLPPILIERIAKFRKICQDLGVRD